MLEITAARTSVLNTNMKKSSGMFDTAIQLILVGTGIGHEIMTFCAITQKIFQMTKIWNLLKNDHIHAPF